MLINIHDIWSPSVRRKHKAYIKEIIDSAVLPKGSLLEKFIDSHGRHLATGTPARLRQVIEAAEQLKKSSSAVLFQQFMDDCNKLFDYGKFSNKQTKGWNAYEICKSSQYHTCPYCQQAVAFTIHRDSKTKSFRPTLDHFYPKGEYPYLSLSIYNLIPSCYICNSSLKGKVDFFKEAHLHPYEDRELIRYEWNVEDYIARRENASTNSNSVILPGIKLLAIAATNSLSEAAKNSRETFLVQERLEINEHLMQSFASTLITHGDGRLAVINQEIFDRYQWHLSETEALQFSYANYKNEWLGRLKADLYEAAWRKRY